MVRTEIEQFSLQSGRCHLVGTRANVHGRQRGLIVALPTINAFGFHHFVFTGRFRLCRCRCRTRRRVLKQGSRRLAWFFRVRWIQHKRRRSQQELSRFHLIVVERKRAMTRRSQDEGNVVTAWKNEKRIFCRKVFSFVVSEHSFCRMAMHGRNVKKN